MERCGRWDHDVLKIPPGCVRVYDSVGLPGQLSLPIPQLWSAPTWDAVAPTCDAVALTCDAGYIVASDQNVMSPTWDVVAHTWDWSGIYLRYLPGIE